MLSFGKRNTEIVIITKCQVEVGWGGEKNPKVFLSREEVFKIEPGPVNLAINAFLF